MMPISPHPEEIHRSHRAAWQLHQHDAVGSHARDELGIDHEALANPAQAAIASAVAFSVGAAVPIIAGVLSLRDMSVITIVSASMLMLAISGATGAYVGGGNKFVAAARVFLGGGAAMAITAVVGKLVGASL